LEADNPADLFSGFSDSSVVKRNSKMLEFENDRVKKRLLPEVVSEENIH
jgi:hypothetical protein